MEANGRREDASVDWRCWRVYRVQAALCWSSAQRMEWSAWTCRRFMRAPTRNVVVTSGRRMSRCDGAWAHDLAVPQPYIDGRRFPCRYLQRLQMLEVEIFIRAWLRASD